MNDETDGAGFAKDRRPRADIDAVLIGDRIFDRQMLRRRQWRGVVLVKERTRREARPGHKPRLDGGFDSSARHRPSQIDDNGGLDRRRRRMRWLLDTRHVQIGEADVGGGAEALPRAATAWYTPSGALRDSPGLPSCGSISGA
jgi:hypothetical protein